MCGKIPSDFIFFLPIPSDIQAFAWHDWFHEYALKTPD